MYVGSQYINPTPNSIERLIACSICFCIADEIRLCVCGDRHIYEGSIIIHETVLASRIFKLVIVKLVPEVRADIYCCPRFVTVPPLTVRKILEFAVTFVVETVTVPAVRVAVPIVAFVPSLI